MTYQRVPYAEASPQSEMTADCSAVEAALRLPSRLSPAERAVRAATRLAPSIRYEDQSHDVAKPAVTVSAAARRLAAVYTD